MIDLFRLISRVGPEDEDGREPETEDTGSSSGSDEKK
jgi:hypothetical protein